MSTLRRDSGTYDVEQDTSVDRNGVLPSASGINATIARLFSDHPPISGVFGGQGTNTTGPRTVRGGGTVRVGPGEYLIEAPIDLPPNLRLELDGAHLVAAPALNGDPMLRAVQNGLANFNLNGIEVVGKAGAGLHGEGEGGIGVDFNRVAMGTLQNLVVDNFLSHGVRLGLGQWSRLDRLRLIGNGGWGLLYDGDPAGGDPGGVTFEYQNDTLIENCLIEENAAGGMLAHVGGTFNAIGCSFQFHNSQPGVRIQAQTNSGRSVFAGAFTGCHFESNSVGAEILRPVGGGTNWMAHAVSFNHCYWPLSDGTGSGSGVSAYPQNRLIVNHGHQTQVVGGATQNDEASMPTTVATGGGPATNALFEQSSTDGSLHVINFFGARGAGGFLPYCTNELGVLYPETFAPQNAVFGVTGIGRLAGNGFPPFPSGGFFGPNSSNV